jgi:hypothetical protein
MPVPMPVTEILSDKRPIAIREVTAVDLLRGVVQLMAITVAKSATPYQIKSSTRIYLQMLCSGIALAAPFLWALKLLVQAFTAPPPLSCRAIVTGGWSIYAIQVALQFSIVVSWRRVSSLISTLVLTPPPTSALVVNLHFHSVL